MAKDRLKRSGLRAQRVGFLAKTLKQAKKLALTRVTPQGLWGHEATGISPSEVEKVRGQVARCLGQTTTGRDLGVLLHLEFGAGKDPYIKPSWIS